MCVALIPDHFLIKTTFGTLKPHCFFWKNKCLNGVILLRACLFIIYFLFYFTCNIIFILNSKYLQPTISFFWLVYSIFELVNFWRIRIRKRRLRRCKRRRRSRVVSSREEELTCCSTILPGSFLSGLVQLNRTKLVKYEVSL